MMQGEFFCKICFLAIFDYNQGGSFISLMGMEKKSRYSNDITLSALSGLLFFSPFIKSFLKKNSERWGDEAQKFVFSRCKVGDGLWILLFLFALSFWIGEWSQLSFFFALAEVFGYLLLSILAFSFPLLISGASFQLSKLQQDARQKQQLLASFIPLWSSYQRFRLQAFEKPYRWLKEAQVWLFGIRLSLLLFPSPMPWLILGALLLLRVSLLAGGWDLLSQEQKIWLHRGFHIFPWEMFSLLFVQIQSLVAKRNKKPFNPQTRLLSYQASYREAWKRKTWILTLCFGVPIGMLLAWSWWKTELWRKLIPIFWAGAWGFLIFRSKTPISKLPIIAELTAQNETSF